MITFKIGKQVSYRTQRGNSGNGKIVATPPAGANGQFIHVEPAGLKGKVLKLRPAQLSAA